MQLGLTAAALATDGDIQGNISGSGITLIILNEEIDVIMKIVKFLEDSGSLKKSVCKTIENQANEQNSGFFSMLLVYLEIL